MQKGLLIAEKDSLCTAIKDVYNKIKGELPYNLDFAVQSGHLVQLKEPDEYDESFKKWQWETLPIIPSEMGGWRYKLIPATKKKFYRIKELLETNSYDFIVHAGDPDREGEYLVHLVLSLLKCRLPVKRFWTNDISPHSVEKELKHLHNDADPKYQNLLKAAYCRARFDWMYGINMTRAASLAMEGTARCGRVKTPVLKIVVDREKEIAAFKPSNYYTLSCKYKEGFTGILFDENGNVTFRTESDAKNVMRQLRDTANIIKSETERKQAFAPSLFNLSTLQIEASKKFGFDPDETLSIVQSLYEQKYLSYPRTACTYLSSEVAAYFDNILDSISTIPSLPPFIEQVTEEDKQRVKNTKKYINDKAIEEEGHTALIPTVEKPDWNQLNDKEQKIYQTVAKRFLAVFLPPVIYEKTAVITENNGHTFRTSGKIIIQKGYSELYGAKFSEDEIPSVQEGEIVHVDELIPEKKTTVCPKRYTSGDLIDLMATPGKFLLNQGYKDIIKQIKGIGTEATRSEIIKELINNGYIEKKKGKGKAAFLYATKTGMAIIDNLKNPNITSIDLTAEWETKLKEIERGEKEPNAFYTEAKDFVTENINLLKNTETVSIKNLDRTVGVCPVCGKPVFSSQKGWFCTGFKEKSCNFFMRKVICGKRLSDSQMTSLLEKGYTPNIKGLKTKEGKEFEAFLVYDKEFTIHFVRSFIAGKKLTESNLKSLLKKGKTNKIKGFVSKNGKNFDAKLKMENYQISFDF